MKKTILSVVCLMVVGIQSVKAEPVILALHHEGNVTFYYDYQFNDAQSAAEDGDTIFISEGVYAGSIFLNKPIHVIGGGQNTVIYGGIEIMIETDKPLEGFLLENLKVQGAIYAQYRDISGLRMRKVYANSWAMKWHITGECTATDCLFDRCYFKDTGIGGLRNAVFVNCKISGFGTWGDGTSAVQFVNCNVKGNSYMDATYRNCIISTNSLVGYFEKCLIYAEGEGNATKTDCYTYETSPLDDILECSIPTDQLSQYVGSDSTVVGCYGGETPFTLSTTTPRVLHKDVTLDKAAKKLNVNITIGTE